jgi:hypothetical protein
MRVLVGCEFSDTVRSEFERLGHDAWSCDLLPSLKPGNRKHIQGDVRKYLRDGWDMFIGHPPCTFVCRGGLNWINRDPGRKEKMYEAIEFFKELDQAPIYYKALENPIGKINTVYRKPDQIVYAYQFGHIYSKDICLWLTNLPPLKPTMIVPGPYKTLDFASQDPKRWHKKVKTFSGLARAMAEQWGSIKEPVMA